MTSSYIDYFTTIVGGGCFATAVPLETNIDSSALLLALFRHLDETGAPITAHGLETLFALPFFRDTLPFAAHIQEHFAVTHLTHCSPAFQAAWTAVIVPVWAAAAATVAPHQNDEKPVSHH
jgi:hypothetical protein